MANPGWGEESQTIADSWVPAAARPSKPLGQSLVLPPPVWRGGKDSGWLGGSALAGEEGLSLQICPAAGLPVSPESQESGDRPSYFQASSLR